MPRGHYPRKPLSPEHRANIGLSLNGRPVTQETRRKISSKLKGRILKPLDKLSGWRWSEESRRAWSDRQRGKLGHKHSEETKRLLGDIRRGALGSNWQGGKTDESKLARNTSEYRVWREEVYRRDGYTCLKCRQVGGKMQLHPHHVHNFARYPHLRYSVENGATLCVTCHKAFHRLFGKRHNFLAQIAVFLIIDGFEIENTQKQLGSGE